jgi:flagellar protein FliO/FliZ
MDNFASQLLSTLFALSVVIALAWGGLYFLKRLQPGRFGKPGSAPTTELRFIRALPVGTKERVVVMHYRGEEWLLGVGAGNVRLLSKHAIETGPSPVSLDKSS